MEEDWPLELGIVDDDLLLEDGGGVEDGWLLDEGLVLEDDGVVDDTVLLLLVLLLLLDDEVGKIVVLENHDPLLSVRISTTPVSVNSLPAEFVVVMVVVYSVGFVPGAVGTGLQAILQDAGKARAGTGPL